ncbi:MAG: helix-turn-helix transcriptional regulator [Prevotellaceae bacterium]|jgi:DNA-binding CsgD family transcriptional regulator|nr:helix-turn-helix transcriptional regulator [Prevotellaceae bacterium]
MYNIQQFFDPIRKISSDLPYNEISPLIEMCDLFSRANNISAYIIDYATERFLHVSPHPLFLSGYTAEEVKEMSYTFYEKVVSPQEIQMLLEINKMGWEFFYRLSLKERLLLRISYSFYLHHQNGKKKLIHHKLVPMQLAADGNLWLAICFVSNSPHKEPGNVVFTTSNKNEYYRYDFENQKIITYTPEELTFREIEIFNLTMRGYEEPQIAEQLKISPYTIKSHRRKIIKKLGANNLSNAVAIFNSMF